MVGSGYFIWEPVSKDRNFGLDVMRATGLFMVLLGHSVHFFEPFYSKIYRLSFFYINGIDLFFSLSGFLIGNIIIKSFIQESEYKITTVFTFLKRRWYKILPSYYMAIVINYILGIVITGAHHDFNFNYLSFTHTFFIANTHFLPVSYSLCIEEWFYILFPFMFIFFIHFFRGKISPIKVLMLTCCIFILTSLIFRSMVFFNTKVHWDMVMRKSVYMRLDSSVYGVLFSVFYMLCKNWCKKFKKKLFFSGVFLYTVTMLFRVFIPEGYIHHVIYFTTIPISFSLMIPWFIELKPTNTFLLKLFTAISLISYSFYLFHLSPLNELFYKWMQEMSLFNTVSMYVLYVIVTFGISILWYVSVERPIMNLRDRKLFV